MSSLFSMDAPWKSGFQIALGGQAMFASNAPSCPHAQISCHNTSVVADLCCFNAPGGQMLQTQFWDTHPPTGPDDAWTMHGLWPDHCDGTFDAYCDDTRNHHNITAILESFNATDLLSTMSTYWKDYQGHDQSLWWHEWGKHGTCISTLNPSCYPDYVPQIEVLDYFTTAVSLYQRLPSYDFLHTAGIVPSDTVRYTRAEIQDTLEQAFTKPVTLGCRNGALTEIWYHFDVKGSVQTGTFIPTEPDGTKGSCPATGIKYLPKKGTRPSPTRTDAPPPAPTATGPPFTGKGQLVVRTGGESKGCIISGGTWYMSGTCAGFTAEQVEDGFVLSSRKGRCAVHKDALLCAAHVREGTIFGSEGSKLVFEGNTTFFANEVPKRFKQGTVYVEQESRKTELEIEWLAV